MDEYLPAAVMLVAVWSFFIFRLGVWFGRGGRSDPMDLSGPPVPASTELRVASIPEHLRPEIEKALASGRKIQAIKQLRDATGLGLKEAKDYVEAMERRR